MRPYNQGNLATNINPKQKPKQKVLQKKRTVIRPGISGGEKLMYFFAVILFVSVLSSVIARYTMISSYNYQIIQAKKDIKKMSESNGELKVQIDALSKPDRIREVAQQMGLTKNDDTVRVVKDNRTSN
ncbi:cell division protein FtsL [Aneurinibacillus tyrosinisolvens]|uniref:cell division protein FtsL n=1 Tax=Aneurinibacillus tyrosinisolvens TaxID=1443435 RepID=UPI00063F0BAF|nr:cell division protein FtsL [Aneurinibacillus tyrosinisolvens]